MAQNLSRRRLSASRVKRPSSLIRFLCLENTESVSSDLDAGIRMRFDGFMAASGFVLSCFLDDPPIPEITLHVFYMA